MNKLATTQILVFLFSLSSALGEIYVYQSEALDAFDPGKPTQDKANWCWAACLQYLFRQSGIDMSQDKIVSRIKGSAIDEGGSPAELNESVNFKVKTDKGEIAESWGYTMPMLSYHPMSVPKWLDMGFPVIALCNFRGFRHAVLITGISIDQDPENFIVRHYFIYDPYPIPERLTEVRANRQVWSGMQFDQRIEAIVFVMAGTEEAVKRASKSYSDAYEIEMNAKLSMWEILEKTAPGGKKFDSTQGYNGWLESLYKSGDVARIRYPEVLEPVAEIPPTSKIVVSKEVNFTKFTSDDISFGRDGTKLIELRSWLIHIDEAGLDKYPDARHIERIYFLGELDQTRIAPGTYEVERVVYRYTPSDDPEGGGTESTTIFIKGFKEDGIYSIEVVIDADPPLAVEPMHVGLLRAILEPHGIGLEFPRRPAGVVPSRQ